MDALLTTSQIAETFKVTVDTVQNWAAAKKIAHYKVGGELRFTQKDIDAFLSSRRSEARPTLQGARLRRVGRDD